MSQNSEDVVGGMIFSDTQHSEDDLVQLFLESLKTFNLLLSSSVIDNAVIQNIKNIFGLKNTADFNFKEGLSFALGELTSLVKRDKKNLIYFCIKDDKVLKLYCFNILTSDFSFKEFYIDGDIASQLIFQEIDAKQKIKTIVENNPGYFLEQTSRFFSKINFN